MHNNTFTGMFEIWFKIVQVLPHFPKNAEKSWKEKSITKTSLWKLECWHMGVHYTCFSTLVCFEIPINEIPKTQVLKTFKAHRHQPISGLNWI